jgi:hypothetical protein
MRRSNAVDAAPRASSLDDWSAGDEAIDDHDYGNDEQEMDQPSTHVHEKESKNPKYEENYGDGPQHDGILARSELHIAPQEISQAWHTSELRLRVMLGHGVHMATNMPDVLNRPRLE